MEKVCTAHTDASVHCRETPPSHEALEEAFQLYAKFLAATPAPSDADARRIYDEASRIYGSRFTRIERALEGRVYGAALLEVQNDLMWQDKRIKTLQEMVLLQTQCIAKLISLQPASSAKSSSGLKRPKPPSGADSGEQRSV
jgi:hypothetical protein